MQKINNSFTCEYCGKGVKPHLNSSRNHCTYCLYSKHLDLNTPGDRLSVCHGLMRPISLDYNGKKGNVLVYECEKCGRGMRNKVADDDCWEKVVELTG
ncbi:RNHCP domain-containing protein [Candidatus Peregrinibacteria bacterium]|jgi:hypothetical protein|nr:RNHCP domain-containing protein [Candidatus Peregrinibacteria bacterium]